MLGDLNIAIENIAGLFQSMQFFNHRYRKRGIALGPSKEGTLVLSSQGGEIIEASHRPHHNRARNSEFRVRVQIR